MVDRLGPSRLKEHGDELPEFSFFFTCPKLEAEEASTLEMPTGRDC